MDKKKKKKLKKKKQKQKNNFLESIMWSVIENNRPCEKGVLYLISCSFTDFE